VGGQRVLSRPSEDSFAVGRRQKVPTRYIRRNCVLRGCRKWSRFCGSHRLPSYSARAGSIPKTLSFLKILKMTNGTKNSLVLYARRRL
jgi:hypothetical protein